MLQGKYLSGPFKLALYQGLALLITVKVAIQTAAILISVLPNNGRTIGKQLINFITAGITLICIPNLLFFLMMRKMAMRYDKENPGIFLDITARLPKPGCWVQKKQ